MKDSSMRDAHCAPKQALRLRLLLNLMASVGAGVSHIQRDVARISRELLRHCCFTLPCNMVVWPNGFIHTTSSGRMARDVSPAIASGSAKR
jgi:hypothetical protein